MKTMTNLFPDLDANTRRGLETLLPLIEKTFPIPGRFRLGLAKDVAELSRLLTSARGERGLSYLNRPPLLSAYLRYFLPWNLYRLCRLLPGLEIPLAPGSVIVDLGAGPLTFAIALWLCRPDLRAVALEFRCLDRSKTALDAGKKLFATLSGGGVAQENAGGDRADGAHGAGSDTADRCPWVIKTTHSEINPAALRALVTRTQGVTAPARGAALVCAVNLYNEMFPSPGDAEGLRRFAKTQAALLRDLAAQDILVVEPGVPRSGQFITLLREALISGGCAPRAPCLHPGACPFPGVGAGNGGAGRAGGGAAKWCHFPFDTEDAPVGLHKLSAAAGIPKERAVLSFLLAGRGTAPVSADSNSAGDDTIAVRVISDSFPLPGQNGRTAGPQAGRYGCAEKGMVLLRGERRTVELLRPGVVVNVKLTTLRDAKSGALVGEV